MRKSPQTQTLKLVQPSALVPSAMRTLCTMLLLKACLFGGVQGLIAAKQVPSTL